MIGIVVGEIYGSAIGVGAMINQAGSRFQTDKVFVGVLTIVAFGVVLVDLCSGSSAGSRSGVPRHEPTR